MRADRCKLCIQNNCSYMCRCSCHEEAEEDYYQQRLNKAMDEQKRRRERNGGYGVMGSYDQQKDQRQWSITINGNRGVYRDITYPVPVEELKALIIEGIADMRRRGILEAEGLLQKFQDMLDRSEMEEAEAQADKAIRRIQYLERMRRTEGSRADHQTCATCGQPRGVHDKNQAVWPRPKDWHEFKSVAVAEMENRRANAHDIA